MNCLAKVRGQGTIFSVNNNGQSRMMNKTMMSGCAALAALMAPAMARAQAAAPAAAAVAPAPPVDPARLAEAQKVIDLIMPPASRDQMIKTMMNAMMGNASKVMSESPLFGSDDPKLRAAAERAVARMQKEMIDLITPSMPAMSAAMAHAYARRFTLEQLQQMETFFGSPAGQAYVSHVADIFSDPDVVAWQRDLMQRQMARMPAMLEEMRRDAEAAAGGSPKAKQGARAQ